MRLHTDTSERTLRDAATKAGVTFARLERHGSRSRSHAFDVILEGAGRHGGQWGGQYRSATWDQWGIFLARIFEKDPNMKCRAYDGADDFHWLTGGRFRRLELSNQHIRHLWAYSGTCVTGRYSVHDCLCGARRRTVHFHYSG